MKFSTISYKTSTSVSCNGSIRSSWKYLTCTNSEILMWNRRVLTWANEGCVWLMLFTIFSFKLIFCNYFIFALSTWLQERDIQRIDTLSANEAKKAKISSRIEHLRRHMDEVQSQKEALNERLCANNESIGRVQAEINTACSDSNKPGQFTWGFLLYFYT